MSAVKDLVASQSSYVDRLMREAQGGDSFSKLPQPPSVPGQAGRQGRNTPPSLLGPDGVNSTHQPAATISSFFGSDAGGLDDHPESAFSSLLGLDGDASIPPSTAYSAVLHASATSSQSSDAFRPSEAEILAQAQRARAMFSDDRSESTAPSGTDTSAVSSGSDARRSVSSYDRAPRLPLEHHTDEQPRPAAGQLSALDRLARGHNSEPWAATQSLHDDATQSRTTESHSSRGLAYSGLDSLPLASRASLSSATSHSVTSATVTTTRPSATPSTAPYLPNTDGAAVSFHPRMPPPSSVPYPATQPFSSSSAPYQTTTTPQPTSNHGFDRHSADAARVRDDERQEERKRAERMHEQLKLSQRAAHQATAALEGQRQEARRQLEVEQRETREAKKTIERLRAELESVRTDARELEKVIEAEHSSRLQAEATLSNTREGEAHWKQRARTAEDQRSSVQEEFATAQQTISELKEALGTATAANRHASDNVKTSAQRIAELETQLEQCRASAERVRLELERTKTRSATVAEVAKAREEDLLHRMARAEAEAAAGRRTVARLTLESNGLRTQCENAQHALDAMIAGTSEEQPRDRRRADREKLNQGEDEPRGSSGADAAPREGNAPAALVSPPPTIPRLPVPVRHAEEGALAHDPASIASSRESRASTESFSTTDGTTSTSPRTSVPIGRTTTPIGAQQDAVQDIVEDAVRAERRRNRLEAAEREARAAREWTAERRVLEDRIRRLQREQNMAAYRAQTEGRRPETGVRSPTGTAGLTAASPTVQRTHDHALGVDARERSRARFQALGTGSFRGPFPEPTQDVGAHSDFEPVPAAISTPPRMPEVPDGSSDPVATRASVLNLGENVEDARSASNTAESEVSPSASVSARSIPIALEAAMQSEGGRVNDGEGELPATTAWTTSARRSESPTESEERWEPREDAFGRREPATIGGDRLTPDAGKHGAALSRPKELETTKPTASTRAPDSVPGASARMRLLDVSEDEQQETTAHMTARGKARQAVRRQRQRQQQQQRQRQREQSGRLAAAGSRQPRPASRTVVQSTGGSRLPARAKSAPRRRVVRAEESTVDPRQKHLRPSSGGRHTRASGATSAAAISTSATAQAQNERQNPSKPEDDAERGPWAADRSTASAKSRKRKTKGRGRSVSQSRTSAGSGLPNNAVRRPVSAARRRRRAVEIPTATSSSVTPSGSAAPSQRRPRVRKTVKGHGTRGVVGAQTRASALRAAANQRAIDARKGNQRVRPRKVLSRGQENAVGRRLSGISETQLPEEGAGTAQASGGRDRSVQGQPPKLVDRVRSEQVPQGATAAGGVSVVCRRVSQPSVTSSEKEMRVQRDVEELVLMQQRQEQTLRELSLDFAD